MLSEQRPCLSNSGGMGVHGVVTMSHHIKLKSPFPYFGGKSRVAPLVWERLGDVDNCIEPFCGSAAFLLARPHPPRIETLNDVNVYIANFWRATIADPEAVAAYADAPVNECDMHANHRWLVLSEPAAEFRRRMRNDPDYFDAKVAGRWVHGACWWIGSGWCDTPESAEWDQRPSLHRGVHPGSGGLSAKMPNIGDWAGGRGVNSDLIHAGTCAERRAWLVDWFSRLRDRLRTVRVCCGHWLRVCDSPSVTTRLGLTGVFLDPPYPTHAPDGSESRTGSLYSGDDRDALDRLRDDVLVWCRARGPDPLMRICVAAYDTDGYDTLLDCSWECVAWRSAGGYGNRSEKGRANAARERLYFSPHCTRLGDDMPLFRHMEDDI